MEKIKTKLKPLIKVFAIVFLLVFVCLSIKVFVNAKISILLTFVITSVIIYYLLDALNSSISTKELSNEQKRLINYIINNYPKTASEKVVLANKNNSQGWMQLLVIINKFYTGLKEEISKTQKDFLNKL